MSAATGVTKQTVIDSWQAVLRHNWFFVLVVLLFLAAGGYFAVTNPLGSTPDEAYHYAAIQTYSKQYSPWVEHQDSVAQTNDMVRYPSYLYHYLLSFPYRLLHGLGTSDRATLVTLRMLTLLLGVATLIVLRQLLLKITTSRRLAELGVALFGLLPITLIVYGGLNYDSLMWLLAFCSLLLLYSMRQQPSLLKALLVASLLMAGALTQYSYLPLAAAEGVYLLILVVRHRKQLLGGHGRHARLGLVLATVLFIGMAGLFVERYGVNAVSYGTVNPDCKQIHSLQMCLEFPINARNYAGAASNTPGAFSNVAYVYQWGRLMFEGLVYPLPGVLGKSAYLLGATAILGGLTVLIARTKAYKDNEFGWFLTISAVLYVLVVFLTNYDLYRHMHQIWAVNGRYLIPVVPFLGVIIAANLKSGYSGLAQDARMLVHRRQRRAVLAIGRVLYSNND